MNKTWNLTYYSDGQPVSERSGVSQQDALVELFRLARGEAPAPAAQAPAPVELDQIAAPTETGELALAA